MSKKVAIETISQFEITDGVKLEFYLFKLETHLYEITVRGKIIPLEDVKIEHWLLWAYEEELKDIIIENEDLILDIEYEEV